MQKIYKKNFLFVNTDGNKTRLKIKKKILQIEDIKKVEIGLKNSLLRLTLQNYLEKCL